MGSGPTTGRCRPLLPPTRAASAPDAPTVDPSTTGSDTDSSTASSSAPKVLLTGYAAESGALPDVLAATFPERFPTLSAARKGEWRHVCNSRCKAGKQASPAAGHMCAAAWRQELYKQ